MSQHYDALETRSPQDREAALMAALPTQIAHAQQHSAAMAEILKGVDASRITSRAALAQLPVTRKYALLERQQAQRAQDPFGGFSTIGWKGLVRSSGARRVYQSPGPIYEPEGAGADYWRAARAMAAAGFEAGDLEAGDILSEDRGRARDATQRAIAQRLAIFPAGDDE